MHYLLPRSILRTSVSNTVASCLVRGSVYRSCVPSISIRSSRSAANSSNSNLSRPPFTPMTSDLALDKNFPLEELLPKRETQQEAFLTEHPEYDGRGILIAILDTGVDAALPGLQVTTTGERKIVDCIDCSGAGDVDTKTVKQATEGFVEGLTGRKLQIPSDWVNPSGKWHLGIKPINDLYAKSIRNVVKKDRKSEWDSQHQMALADSLRKLASHEESVGGTSEKLIDKLDREDLASQVDFLKAMDKMEDRGPIADVIAWNDGKEWIACLDTSFRGRLGQCTPMPSFRTSGKYGKLTQYDSATYTFRIDPSGNRVEICVANGSHGSHVANIAAACFPDEPRRNGLAPGAKIVSLTIGDNRVDSMETGTGLTRAINLCSEMGVDVINMSYGEGTHIYNSGAIVDEFKKIIEKKKTVILVSAGNNGPALSTVGAPGGTTSGILGIGAMLTPPMADPLYGVFNEIEGNLYSWSSRGPCPDGWLGVSLCAPGAAFAGVPQCERQAVQMMNGTSMSSPNAAGAVASLLSGLRQSGIEWTPGIIRIALENTARKLENADKFSCGQGLVQIKNAFDFLSQHQAFLPLTLCRFDVKVVQTNISKRGVYLRELAETSSKQEYTVHIKSIFEELSDHSSQYAFERHFHLKTSVPWVKAPSTFVSVAQERSFFMTVEPTLLPEGSVHYAEVVGIDDSNPALGPLFRVPITVVRPEVLSKEQDYSATYTFDAPSGVPVRKFFAVPKEASCAQITVKNLSKEHLDRFVLHCIQLEEQKSYRNSEAYKQLGPDGAEWTKWVKLTGGRTLEVCLTRSWTRGPHTKVELMVRFHGIQKPTNLTVIHGAGPNEFRLAAAPFRPVDISPSITLSSLVVPHKPSASKVEPLSSRDIFQVSGEPVQIFQLINTYNLKLTKQGEVRFELTGLSPYLYESPIDSLFIQVFSTSKEYISSSSSFPDRYTHKLEKGDYVVKVQLRNAQESVLTKFTDSPLLVHVKIGSSISVDLHSNLEAAITGNNGFKWSSKSLQPSQQIALYTSCIAEDKLPKNINIVGGSYLLGKLSVMDDAEAKKVDVCPVIYLFPEFSTRPSKALSMVVLKEKKQQTEQIQEMKDAIRDLQISWLEKLKDAVEAEKLYAELITKYPTHLPLLTTKLKLLMNNRTPSTNDRKLQSLIVEQILQLCNPPEVLQFLGVRQEHSERFTEKKKEMDEKKTAIIDALVARANALLDVHLKASTEDVPKILRTGIEAILEERKVDESKDKESKDKEKEPVEKALKEDTTQTTASVSEEENTSVSRKDVDDAYMELLKWIASDDSKCCIVSAKHAAAYGHMGRCLKYMMKALEDGRSNNKETKSIEIAIAEVCNKLGWVHIANRMKNETLIRHPPAFRPF